MSEQRGSFTGKIGFVLAAAGSAVGLGNIWRFPYLAAKYGGGIFLLVYILLGVTFGFALMCAEIAIGRKTGQSAINAFSALDKRFSFLGKLVSIVPVIILPYYSVIGGWVMKYFWAFVSGGAKATTDAEYFGNFISSTASPIFWFCMFIAITALIVLFGVQKGVEQMSKIMMPVLVILTLGIAIYSVCLPGALEGFIFYIKPDFSKFSITTVLAAMGQLFYSMSLAMGIMITYGSYMKKDIKIQNSVLQIAGFDSGIAFLAGLMIIPSVFVFFGGDESMLGKGAGLMFETLPRVFDTMPGSAIVGAFFFLLVFFAALTSSISLMETVVSIVMDKFKLKRKAACLAVTGFSLALGIPSSLGYGIWGDFKPLGLSLLDFFDFISNSVIMPIVALITCIFVGYVLKPKALIEEIETTGKFGAKKLFTVVIKYIAPVFIVAILIFSVLEGLGIIKV